MSTKITITYQKKEYVLEYSRNSVKQLEQQGFVLEQVAEKPATMIPMLVYGAFLKNNQGIKRALVEEIYQNLVGKVASDGGEGFISALVEMYAETVSSLTVNTPSDEGNVATWKVTKG